MFLALRLNRPNFLIMDEPTNHIDIDGKEELEAQLSESDATLLMTSHDRRFIDNVATRFLLVADGRLVEINDPETFYERMLEEDGARAAPTRQARPASAPAAASEAPASDEQVLERIVELEALLAADLARKPKFQKPELQAAWRQELEELTGRLGD
jgi:ABC-type multidrug transport system ATPase subunit